MREGVVDRLTPLEEIVPGELLKAEVRVRAERIGVTPKEIHLRPMKRKWASCSSTGRLSFSIDLLNQSAAFRAEVIVHELVHMKVPNHGALFRSLVRAYLAEHRRIEEDSPPYRGRPID